ncbi:hypothetical protein [Sphingopyxis sp.]|uniref:hypothetical protein n=1 Tax=Sphingopyxis sp. TaxID=1908224 RepID=UPI003D0B35EC
MIRKLSFVVAIAISAQAVAQVPSHSRAEALRCAAAALALSGISKIPEEKAKYQKKADAFLEPVIQQNKRDGMSDENFKGEFRVVNEGYKKQLDAFGGSTDQMLMAFEDVEDCSS